MNHRAIYTIAAVAGITLTLLTGACRSETPEPSGLGTAMASPSPIERTEPTEATPPSAQVPPLPEASVVASPTASPSTPEPTTEVPEASPATTPEPSATQPPASTPVVTPTAVPATAVAPPPQPSPTAVNVTIPGFELPSFTVAAGTTVVWTNEHGALHTVTHVEGTFDSGPLQRGDAFEHTFSETGAFPYLCTVHPSMTGTVTVE